MFNKSLSIRKKRKEDTSDFRSDDCHNVSDNSLLSSSNISNSDRDISHSAELRVSDYDSSYGQNASLNNRSSLNKDEEAEEDNLGLKVIFRPLSAPRADVIFVHGLGGSSKMTWSKNRDLSYFWPMKYLPLEEEFKKVRILTFGYNATPTRKSGKTKKSMLDFAKDLLYDLKYARDESPAGTEKLDIGNRPIIFVAHSMGGLIVKEAYIQGLNDPSYQEAIKSIFGIIFLATPHRGTDLAKTLNRILQASFVSNPKHFITELSAGSHKIQSINEQFRHIAPKLQIVSFYETQPTKILMKTRIMVLEKDSAILGYPGEVSKGLDADHHEVCKYHSPTDHRYISVRNALKSILKTADINWAKDIPSHASLTKIEDYLRIYENPSSVFNKTRGQWTPGTCSWILDKSYFSEWRNDNSCSSRILWIQGRAASGKSTLSSYIIEHLIQHSFPCQYYFVRFSNQHSRSGSTILRLLAYQIAYSMPEYASRIRQFAEADTDLQAADLRTIWYWLYHQALFPLNKFNRPLYWVIDGVDEADSSGSIVRLLADLQSSHIPVRALVVSQNKHEISEAFDKVEECVHVDRISIEGNHDDLRSYIEQELNLAGPEDYKQEITAQLLDRSRSNFLWVHLAVQRINACHTKLAIENALMDLPPGMEAFYNRMAESVKVQIMSNDGKVGKTILSWTICAQRLLSVEELNDALGSIGLLEIQRTINDLCGGFLIITTDGMVSLIHETAREYLTRVGDHNRPFSVDERLANDMAYKTCLLCLTSPRTRLSVKRNQPPALLEYVTNSWFIHLSRGTIDEPEITGLFTKFLKGPYILFWMDVAASRKSLRTLVTASRHLSDVALNLRKFQEGNSNTHDQAIRLLEGWATDLVKVVGKFGSTMIEHSEAIYKLIPALCPSESVIYQQFGSKESKLLRVSGLTGSTWDDCLVRFSFEQNVLASSVLAAGTVIAILTNLRNSSHIILYSSVTFEEQRRMHHPERVWSIQVNHLGKLLVSYGYTRTRVWDTMTGDCIKVIQNPPKLPRPHTIHFIQNDNMLLIGDENRCFRRVGLQDDNPQWSLIAEIEEEAFEDAIVNFPICSNLSPDGSMVAFGYRQHPATVWQLEPPVLLGQCRIALNELDMTNQHVTWGEVFHLAWHPLGEEVFGLTQVGLLFKWDPFEEEASTKVNTGANNLAISKEGSLIATGDCMGRIKIFTTVELSLLYQLSYQDPVLHLTFSTDSRRVYDIRGSYGNAWEPNILVRLADISPSPEFHNDHTNEIESQMKQNSRIEYYSARIDNITTISAQSSGSLYCYGTENGVSVLCEAGKGGICVLTRSKSYMSIEQMIWSEDGKFVAIAELSGKVSIKSVEKASNRQGDWQITHILDVSIPLDQGHITGLVFRSDNHNLLVSTLRALFSIVLASQEILKSSLPLTVRNKMWVCHPTLPDYLLGFGTSSVHVFSWIALEQVAVHFYSPTRAANSNINAKDSLVKNSTIPGNVESVKRLMTGVNSTYIFLSISQILSSGRPESHYLLFAAGDIHPNKELPSSLPYLPLPSDLTTYMREPLGLLSGVYLAFLDVDRWICTIYLTSLKAERFQKTQDSESNMGEIERYYFLPGDWATAGEVSLCTINSDGTLLFPRNGEVGAVQSSKLRKELSFK